MKLVPEAIFDQHTIVLGKTRSGKSSVMRLLVEHLLDQEKPVCIVDPKGDWWGLKSSASGKEAGYPVVVFGGEHADVPMNARSGGAVAELAATGNRPCIIDLGGWMPGERTQFWIDFASTYFRSHRGRHYLVIDEVHNLCPKGKIMDPNAGKMLHWSNRLASEGLGKGISLIAASQRPQKVHNDFLTSCETLFAMRVIHKADRDAIRDWIDACGTEEVGKELLNTIASMQRGEAYVYSPEAEFGPKRIQFPLFKTYDSFKAQNANAPVKLKGWADVDLDEVKKKLAAAVAEAEANDPSKLKAKILELQRQLARPSSDTQGRIIHQQNEERGKIIAEAQRNFAQLEKSYGAQIKILQDSIESLQTYMKKVGGEMSHMATLALAKVSLPALKVTPLKNMIEQTPAHATAIQKMWNQVSTGTVRAGGPSPPGRSDVRSDGPDHLPQGERATLVAIGHFFESGEGVDRGQLTILTGYKRSTRDAYISRLKDKGFCVDRNGRIFITDEGITALGTHFEPQPPKGAALVQFWMPKLPAGEKRVLEILLAEAGTPVERWKIDAATGFSRSTRDAYLSRLGAKRLVEAVGPGEVKASEALFA